jgi:hypothetical protein
VHNSARITLQYTGTSIRTFSMIFNSYNAILNSYSRGLLFLLYGGFLLGMLNCFHCPLCFLNVHGLLHIRTLIRNTALNSIFFSFAEPITLGKCLEAFTQEEQLGEKEKYYCSACQAHQVTSKHICSAGFVRKKGEKRCHLLLSKRCHHLPFFF